MIERGKQRREEMKICLKEIFSLRASARLDSSSSSMQEASLGSPREVSKKEREREREREKWPHNTNLLSSLSELAPPHPGSRPCTHRRQEQSITPSPAAWLHESKLPVAYVAVG